MQKGKMNCLLDGFWGSSGKGKTANYLAHRFGVTACSGANMPNAGHTVERDGQRIVNKVLPSAPHGNMSVMTAFLGPGSVFSPERLREEYIDYPATVKIHDRALYLLDRHKEQEQQALSCISSTMQGSAAALVEKTMRRATLLRDQQCLVPKLDPVDFRRQVHEAIDDGMFLHEVSQGWALSLDHGTHYPFCTSRNCTVQGAMDQMCVRPKQMGDVYLNLRSFPIRVGNTSDGYSGDFEPWCRETTWEQVAKDAGLNPNDLMAKEKTTVTKRLRRVGTFPWELAREAAYYSGATALVLTFAEYIDGGAFGVRDWRDLPIKVKDFCRDLKEWVGVPVRFVSTGADTLDMVEVP